MKRDTTAMKRYRIRRMAERLALKIIRNLPQDRFEQDLWHLAAIIEEHLFSEMDQLDEAERQTEKTEALLIKVKGSVNNTASSLLQVGNSGRRRTSRLAATQ
jgi:hypothetical protein